jgi:hypothetical protein
MTYRSFHDAHGVTPEKRVRARTVGEPALDAGYL